jgi:hypothetical protein
VESKKLIKNNKRTKEQLWSRREDFPWLLGTVTVSV